MQKMLGEKAHKVPYMEQGLKKVKLECPKEITNSKFVISCHAFKGSILTLVSC